jgi:hypothetical protein
LRPQVFHRKKATRGATYYFGPNFVRRLLFLEHFPERDLLDFGGQVVLVLHPVVPGQGIEKLVLDLGRERKEKASHLQATDFDVNGRFFIQIMRSPLSTVA